MGLEWFLGLLAVCVAISVVDEYRRAKARGRQRRIVAGGVYRGRR